MQTAQIDLYVSPHGGSRSNNREADEMKWQF